MKTFISWSGDVSRQVATALYNWLRDVFPDIEPWMSDPDIQAGSRWGVDLNKKLAESNFGILCLTRDNLDSRWLLFEAGALSKDLGSSRVVPYRFKLASTDVAPPLSQFQGVDANEPGTLELIKSINAAKKERRLDEDRLERTFRKWWSDLEQNLEEINLSGPARPIREEQEEQLAKLVHGYSGEWEVKSNFSRWRDYELGEKDTVYFDGTTFLLLSVDGKEGSGTQKGKLYVSIDNYKVIFEIANRINRAYITEAGTLHMDVEVLSRKRIQEEGEPREARVREELFGSGKFSLDLKPVPGESKRLKGIHLYLPGDRLTQEAKEDFKYSGFSPSAWSQ